MAEPIVFTSQTPRFSIPMLFAGQAQKEFFFNEAQLLIDALLHLAIEGMVSAPPTTPEDGDCWIVDAAGQGEWFGKEGSIAVRVANSWKFIAPKDGMTAFDRSLGQNYFFDSAWRTAAEPVEPQGGTVVDSEVRAAFTTLLTSLKTQGVLPRT